MKVYEIQLRKGAQRFIVNLNKINYQITLHWRNPHGWFMDIASINEMARINSIPVVTGLNLLAQYQHKIAGKLWLSMPEQSNPTYADIGITAKLYWIEV